MSYAKNKLSMKQPIVVIERYKDLLSLEPLFSLSIKDICGYCPRAHFLRRETEKVRLGPVFRPSMNSDRNRFLILLFQNDVLPLSRQSKVTKICPKYLIDLSSDMIVAE